MNKEPRVRISCPTHRRTTIARIYLNEQMELEVVLISIQPEPSETEETLVALEDARATRWKESGTPLFTWCKDCGKEHMPTIEWLREIGETPKGQPVFCPCGVESSN